MLSVGDLSFDKTVRRVVAYYLANYDILKLKVNTDEQKRAVAFAADMLVGMEIMEDTGEEMELTMHLIRPEIEVEKILEKLSNICLSMLSDFMKMSLENFDRKIASSITFRENEVDRFYLFVIRIARNSSFLDLLLVLWKG
jgi:phosphate uptake regulator